MQRPLLGTTSPPSLWSSIPTPLNHFKLAAFLQTAEDTVNSMDASQNTPSAPQQPRKLMDLPHEIVLKIIDEVILTDRATGADQIRAHSATYALSRTSAYWQAEVEKRHKVLYLETSLFPGFARWSLHSDWLFRRDRFSVPSTPPAKPRPRDAESISPVARPKTQASSLELMGPPDFSKQEGQSNEPPADESDARSVGNLDCSALSISSSV